MVAPAVAVIPGMTLTPADKDVSLAVDRSDPSP